MIRHHSAIRMVQKVGEGSSFNLDKYLEYGPTTKVRRSRSSKSQSSKSVAVSSESSLYEPLPSIICEYIPSAPPPSYENIMETIGRSESRGRAQNNVEEVQNTYGDVLMVADLDNIYKGMIMYSDCNKPRFISLCFDQPYVLTSSISKQLMMIHRDIEELRYL